MSGRNMLTDSERYDMRTAGNTHHIDVRGRPLPMLKAAIAVACIDWVNGDSEKMMCYRIEEVDGVPHLFISHWMKQDGYTPFLVPQSPEEVYVLASRWLEALHPDAYPKPRPDIDGSVDRGWRVTNRIDYTSTFTVAPCWVEFHK